MAETQPMETRTWLVNMLGGITTQEDVGPVVLWASPEEVRQVLRVHPLVLVMGRVLLPRAKFVQMVTHYDEHRYSDPAPPNPLQHVAQPVKMTVTYDTPEFSEQEGVRCRVEVDHSDPEDLAFAKCFILTDLALRGWEWDPDVPPEDVARAESYVETHWGPGLGGARGPWLQSW